MARIRLKMLPLSLLPLIGLIARGVPASLSSSSSSSSSSSPPADGAVSSSPSPSAEVELICHTDNPDECYPKVFQATDEFQVVHDDQDLPLGLHVRLNVYTGQKEAKLNVPDEDNPALEGLPVDSSIVIVERDPDEAAAAAAAARNDKQPRIPANAPPYDPAGKVKEPPASAASSSGEGSTFYESLGVLKKGGSGGGVDEEAALETLAEMSHDIYYGLKLAEDYEAVRRLFCLATTASPPTSNGRARLAAQTLASTLQNNPKALGEVAAHWPRLSAERCSSSSSSSSSPLTLGQAAFDVLSGEVDPSVVRARVSTLSGLLRDGGIRADFLSAGGPSRLLRLLAKEPAGPESESEWQPAQRTAAFLLLDNFLDGDMGAALGEWPTGAQAPDKECASAAAAEGERYGDGCWDWHVARLAERHKKDKEHWSHELRRKLAEQRKANRAQSRGREEGGKDEL